MLRLIYPNFNPVFARAYKVLEKKSCTLHISQIFTRLIGD